MIAPEVPPVLDTFENEKKNSWKEKLSQVLIKEEIETSTA
jgi:hypothetical protein